MVRPSPWGGASCLPSGPWMATGGSPPPVARTLPSGRNARLLRFSTWEKSVTGSCPTPRSQTRTVRSVPALDGRILAGRGQARPLGSERDVQDRLGMAGVEGHGPRLGIPDRDPAVQSPDRQLPPVRAEGQRVDPAPRGGHRRLLLAVGEVPDPDPAIGAAGGQAPAVGVECDADDVVFVPPEDPEGRR